MREKTPDDVFEKICELLSGCSKGLATLCREHKTSHSTFYQWMQKDPANQTKYAQAREQQADFIFDQITEIADDGSNDTKIIIGKDGQKIEVENVEWTRRSQLRVDARKWVAAKLRPRKYGDKTELTISIEQPLFPDVKLIDDKNENHFIES